MIYNYFCRFVWLLIKAWYTIHGANGCTEVFYKWIRVYWQGGVLWQPQQQRYRVLNTKPQVMPVKRLSPSRWKKALWPSLAPWLSGRAPLARRSLSRMAKSSLPMSAKTTAIRSSMLKSMPIFTILILWDNKNRQISNRTRLKTSGLVLFAFRELYDEQQDTKTEIRWCIAEIAHLPALRQSRLAAVTELLLWQIELRGEKWEVSTTLCWKSCMKRDMSA